MISYYVYTLEHFIIYSCYRPSKHEQSTHQILNHQRLLQPIDELFMTLVHLHLNLLEKDLLQI